MNITETIKLQRSFSFDCGFRERIGRSSHQVVQKCNTQVQFTDALSIKFGIEMWSIGICILTENGGKIRA
jgi:hypothetical protein